MAKMIADGKTKFTILTAAPANPEAPTATELNAGIDISCDVLASNFTWGAGDSNTVSEQALCDESAAEVMTSSVWAGGFTIWRQFASGGGFDADSTAEQAMEILKVKGSTFWAYARQTDKPAREDWAAGDEIYLGGEVVNDNPKRTDGTGFIKYQVPLKVQRGYPFIKVAGA